MRAKFWSDDFDMDLLKVFPDLEPLLATIEAPLYTYSGETYGRINHPTVWNNEGGYIAFFSLHQTVPCKPASYYTGRTPIVQCTWEEAMRDAWAHNYLLTVDRKLIYDGFRAQPDFQTIMWELRGWNKPPDPAAANIAKERVRENILNATLSLEELINAQVQPA